MMLSLLHHQVCVSGFFKTKDAVRLSGQLTLGKALPKVSWPLKRTASLVLKKPLTHT